MKKIIFLLSLILFACISSAQSPASRKAALEALGLSEPYSEDDVKSAYRSLAKVFHPDINRHKGKAEQKAAELKMTQINAAYQQLLLEFSKPKDEYAPFRSLIEKFRLKDVMGNPYPIETIRFLAEYYSKLLSSGSAESCVEFHTNRIAGLHPEVREDADKMAIAAVIQLTIDDPLARDQAMLELLKRRSHPNFYDVWVMTEEVNKIALDQMPKSSAYIFTREPYEREFGESYYNLWIGHVGLIIGKWLKGHPDSSTWLNLLGPYFALDARLGHSFFWRAFANVSEKKYRRLEKNELRFMIEALEASKSDLYGAGTLFLYMSGKWKTHPELIEFKDSLWRLLRNFPAQSKEDISFLEMELRQIVNYAAKEGDEAELAELNRFSELLKDKTCQALLSP